MNIKKIQELIELMNDNDLTEMEVEQEGVKIKLVKKPGGAIEHTISPVSHRVGANGTKPAASSTNVKEIKSPMVGTFYRAASPDAAPYVQAGDMVRKGDVLCIVEAMKLMNEVKSEFNGKIIDILVENTEPVEFGQIMFLLEPA